jgi:hypothetical protein
MTTLILALTLLQQPSVRLIAAPDAHTTVNLADVSVVRALPGGKLLVNDTRRRLLLLVEPTLDRATVVLDSAAGATDGYGPRPGGLIPFRADSSLFIDPVGLSMYVITPAGKVGRVASIPRSQDAGSLASTANGMPGMDLTGRLVYRASINPQRAMNGGMTVGQTPDSLEVVRLHMSSRKLDTAGFVRMAKFKITVTQSDGGMSVAAEMNPVQMIDDWAVLSDGAIALVRGIDYHVDFLGANGLVAGPKVPFEWKALTDEDKVALIDSVKRTMTTPQGTANAPAAAGHGGMTMGPGGHTLSAVTLVPPTALPDFMPAFNSGAARGDADGNLWIRTTARRAGAIGGPIYDVLDRTGKLIDRVQVPAGRSIVGFAPGGVVYLLGREANGDVIERTHR